MTAATLTLTDFLLARIAEDEAVARSVAADLPMGPAEYGHQLWPWRDRIEVRRERVLAECEAKRRIVEDYAHLARFGDNIRAEHRVARGWLEPGVKALAAVYADHPDYRPEWRP